VRRVESFLEQVFEGAIGRLFRSPIQPAEVAKKLERAMEENYVVAVDGVIVPNVYDVLLHPADLANFTAFRGTLVDEMEQWLREVAREERYRFVGPVRVRLAGEEGIPRRSIQVRAAIVDAAAEEPAAAPAGEVYTRDYRVVRTADGSPACRIKVLTGAQAGHVFIVGGKAATIGRALDNDLVIPSTDVSRHHARLEQVSGGYRIVDLGSTNGTLVNGRRVTEQVLAPGDILTLGATELSFQMSDAAETPDRGRSPTQPGAGGDRDGRRA
jgi:hypothetical protein